jgi:hypothetical protein
LAFEGRVNNRREFDAIDVLARLSACHNARSERYPLRTAFDIMWYVPAWLPAWDAYEATRIPYPS